MASFQNLVSSGQLLVLTDQIQSPADFLIHRTLTAHLKEASKPKCLFISISESLAKLKAIAGKSVRRLVLLISRD